jgi:hypothetical protein
LRRLVTLRLRRRHTLPFVGEAGGAARDVPPEVYRDAAAVIDSAIRGDRDAVVGAFDAAVDRAGLRGAYDVACCLAATLVGDPAPAGFAALDFPGIEEARYDARWVARFVSAYANADTPTGEALFGAAMADGQLSECLVTLAGSTVATLKRRGAAG